MKPEDRNPKAEGKPTHEALRPLHPSSFILHP